MRPTPTSLLSPSLSLHSVVSLLGDLSQLVNNPDSFPDVTFVIDGERIYAHKVRGWRHKLDAAMMPR